MFVGHGLVAFALAAAAARLAGWSPERALSLGLLAGAFGLSPDVDILYAPVGVLGASGPFEAASGFWDAGNQVHRAVSHSLVVGTVAGLAAGAWASRTRTGRVLALLALTGVVAVALAVTGALAAVVLAAFAVVCLALARIGRTRLSLGAWPVAAAALVGLLLHPFGDLLTGEPPALLYPLAATVFSERVVLHPDPTLHLLGALFVELGTAWLAALVVLWLHPASRWQLPSPSPSTGAVRSTSGPVRLAALPAALGVRVAARLRRSIDERAGLAVGYAGVLPFLPAPTLEVSYHFVFPLLGIGLVATVLAMRAVDDPLAQRAERAALSGLTAVSLAAVAYTVAYLLLG